MTPSDHDDASLLRGLQALADSSFPKICRTCGRTYRTPEEYAAATLPVRAGRSGLKAAADDEGHPIVELYRNCACGSTLMDFFGDRRKSSDVAHLQREAFEHLLEQLAARGVERVAAREQLLRIVRGERSELLEGLGLGAPASLRARPDK